MERDRPSGEDGFTLIELMVVVLIIAILMAIAVPTFFGARERANVRAAQSNVRNANTNALIVYADAQQFTQDTNVLDGVDGSSLRYTNDLGAVAPTVVYVEVPPAGTYTARDTLYLAAKSVNGSCYWIRSVGDRSEPRFAENDCSAVPAGAAFTDEW